MKTLPLPNAYVLRLSGAALALLALSACVVALAHYRPVAAGPAPVMINPELIVSVAPPAPYVEVVPQRVYPNHVWTAGYWAWQGGRHQWVAGRWEAPPQGRSRWESHRWVQIPGRGWRFDSGRWH